MITGYSNYNVEIVNDEFIAEDGRKYPRTAYVRLFDEKGEEISSESFGEIEIGLIYSQIKNGEALIIDNCYIRDFSLQAYRKLNGLEKKAPVSIRSISARNSFFEAQLATDFSYSSFQDGNISFEGSQFVKGRVNFTGSFFGDGIVNFSNTFFRNGNVEFTGSVFGEGDFLFKNAVVRDGVKDFQDIQFGKVR